MTPTPFPCPSRLLPLIGLYPLAREDRLDPERP
jgi:hypothetical protein